MRNDAKIYRGWQVTTACFLALATLMGLANAQDYSGQAAQYSAEDNANTKLVVALVHALNTRDPSVYSRIFSPDYEGFVPLTESVSTRDHELHTVKEVWHGFPDIKWHILEMLSVDNWVVTRCRLGGTHTGEWAGKTPTGRRFEIESIWMHRIENGKIRELREQVDTYGMLWQLGLIEGWTPVE